MCQLTIFDQCFYFLSSENNRKPKVFWCFQGVGNGNVDQKWLSNEYNQHYC